MIKYSGLDKGDVNVNLKERAIKEYEKEKVLIEESNAREAEKFAEKALKALTDIIGEQGNIVTVVDKQPYCTNFSVDGMLFRVSTSESYDVIYMIRKCPICESDISIRICDLKDIGEALVESHSKYDCDQAIKTSERLKKMKDGHGHECELDTNEKLLEALRDFLLENGCA